MDLGNVSSLYLEDARFAASSMGIGKNALEGGFRRPGVSGGTGGLPSFAELLERSYGETSRDEDAVLPRESGLQARPANTGKPASASPNPRFDASLPTSNSSKPVVDKTDKLYEQCEALETFLVKTLITGMRNTVQKSGFIDEGFAGKMYEDMLYDEYAKDFSQNAGFGLAELAYLELTGQRGKIIVKNP
jgi:flagellar protein FlgJ